MNAPDFNTRIYELDSHEGNWALLLLKQRPGHAAVARCVDGDWELNDSGSEDDMRRKFMRETAPNARAAGARGIGLRAFEKAFPDVIWEKVDEVTVAGVDLELWKWRSRSPNPKAMIVSFWEEMPRHIHWEVRHQGKMDGLTGEWEDLLQNADRAVAPKPSEPDPATSHPNFGLF